MLLLQRTLLITERSGRGKVNSDKVEILLHIIFLGHPPLERDAEREGATSARAMFPFEHAMTCDPREVLMAALLA